jgi:hypothetical protein
MPVARANGIEIAYEAFGRTSDRPLLMITGLGMQMLQWDEPFCEALAARGHFAIRFDNRDTGLSTQFDHAGIPDLGALMRPGADRSGVPYTLDGTARCIPGAELFEIEGLGHGIPPALWDTLADRIAAHTQKAEAARSR